MGMIIPPRLIKWSADGRHGHIRLLHGYDFQKFIGVGHNNRGRDIIAFGAQRIQVAGQQALAFFHGIALLHMGGEVFALQGNRIAANVDEQFHAVRAAQADSMVGIKQGFDRAVKRA